MTVFAPSNFTQSGKGWAAPPHAPPSPLWPASSGFVRDYAKTSPIFYSGDEVTGLSTVVSGLVKLVHLTEAGREITVRLAGPGDVLEPNFLDKNARHSADAHPVTAYVTLNHVSRDVFLQGLGQGAGQEAGRGVPLELFQRVARQLALAEMRVAFSTLPINLRVVWLLGWLSGRFGVPRPGGWTELALPLTHDDVAGIVNSTRVTVTTMFKQLREEGRLRGSRGRYFVRRLPQGYPH